MVSTTPKRSTAKPKTAKGKASAAKSARAKPKASPKAKAKTVPAVITAETVTGEVTRGRPTDYLPQFAVVARKMCAMGATDADLAEAFDVNTTTIWRWQAEHADFCNALKVNKGEFDDRVERSLAQRAVGYSYDAVKIFHPAGAEAPVYAPYREHVPPDPGAAKLWLTNRRKEVWREKVDHELSGGLIVVKLSDDDMKL